MQIYIYRDGQQQGPYSDEDITRYIKEGGIKRDDLAWCDGCADWMPLAKLPGLTLPSGPPPPPPVSVLTVPPPPPPQPPQIAASNTPETLGTIALIVPAVGAFLNFFWVGSMNLLQDPASSLNMISILVVVGTAVMIGIEASHLGIASREDKLRRGTESITPPLVWAIGSMLLWIGVFPYYFHVRARYGVSKRLVLALLVTVLFAISYFATNSAIEDRKSEVRRSLRGMFSP